MLFNTKAVVLLGLFTLGFASPVHHDRDSDSNKEMNIRDMGVSFLDIAPYTPALNTRAKKKTVKGAKCSAKEFTKEQVGQAYAEAKPHVVAATTVRGYPKYFGNNLTWDTKTNKCSGTPVFKDLMNDLREYPIFVTEAGAVTLWSAAGGMTGGDMKYRVVLKANGNFVGVMEHTSGNSFKVCTLVEEEVATPGASDIVPDDTAETTCAATTTTT